MQTFKTYEEIMQHYWGKIVPMAQDAGIDPWECVRICGTDRQNHPSFDFSTEDYTFALTILEGKPVFVGDKLYANNCTQPLTIKGNSEQSGYLSVGDCTNYDISILSWTPPIKKRTFMLGDEEFSDDEISYIIESIFERDGGYTTDLLRKLRQVRSKQNAL